MFKNLKNKIERNPVSSLIVVVLLVCFISVAVAETFRFVKTGRLEVTRSLISSGTLTQSGNASFAGNVSITGATTHTGGHALATSTPTIWSTGGSTVLATAGTDVACSDGARWWTEITIPYNVTLTGIFFLVGSVGGTDSVVVELHNSAGAVVASSVQGDTTIADIVGTAANIQKVPFYSTYAATAGKYYIAVQFNGTTAKFRAYPIPGSAFIAATAAGTFKTGAAITPGTTFTADKGPMSGVY